MGIKRFLFGTDNHGDQQDDETVNAFLSFADRWKPHIKIHGGDVFDFRPLRNGAGAEERAESMERDCITGIAFLDAYRPDYILRGNHDERLWQSAQSATNGNMRDLCGRLVQDIEQQKNWNRATVLPYDVRTGVLKLGQLQFVHGYHAGVAAARQAIGIYKGSGTGVVQGHVHSFSRFADSSLSRAEGISVGALCKIDMPYNAKTPRKLAHENGWAFGEIHQSKSGKSDWELWFCRKGETGKFISPV